jgi:exopolysaccharide production protein ExoQ
MTAIDTQILEYDSSEPMPRDRTWTPYGVFSCLFIAFMFMLATNDPSATEKWEAVTRDQVAKLSVAMESGRAVRQIAFLSLGAWGLLTLFLSKRRFRLDGVFLLPLLILAGWACASVIWSADRSFTAKRIVVFSCIATAVIAFARSFKVRDLALLAFLGCGIQLAGSVVFDLLYAKTDYGLSGYRFSGLQHPNHSGISAMFFIFGCLYFFERTRQRRFLALLAAAAVIMYLTKSRTSLIAGIAAIGVFSMLRWERRTIITLGLTGLAATGLFFVLVATGLVADDWGNIIHMGREDSQAAAFTGRPFIWAAALEWLGNDHSKLLLGSGYDSFWTPEAATYVSNRVWFRISEGHCAYFDMLLEMGVVGLCCYVFLIFASLIRYCRLAWVNASVAYAFAAMIFTFALVHGITESTTVDPNFPTFFSFTAMAILALRAPKLREGDDEVLA